ncbi:MAG: DUF3301 domain-containing protein [Pseudomonadota bacterium]
MNEIIPIVIVALIAWFWWGATRAREVAINAAKAACQRSDVQLLDQTVQLRQLKPKRDPHGRLRIARMYSFEFSVHGVEREAGYAVTLGDALVHVHLDLDAVETPTVH